MNISFLTVIAFVVSCIGAIYCEQHEIDATIFWIFIILSGLDLVNGK